METENTGTKLRETPRHTPEDYRAMRDTCFIVAVAALGVTWAAGGNNPVGHLADLSGAVAWLSLIWAGRYWAFAKGRNPAWGWLGPIGLLVLWLLRDRN